MGKPVLRYDNVTTVITPLDPIEDVSSWISGLRSIGYCEDLLAQKHSSVRPSDRTQCSRSIAAHADTALALLEEAYCGPPQASFLPLYYALLDLSKIMIIAGGKRSELQRERWHGATYNALRKSSQDLLTEEIVLKSGGSIPLLYRVVTGSPSWTGDKRVRMADVYPYIVNIAYEFRACYGREPGCVAATLALDEAQPGHFQLTLQLFPNDRSRQFAARQLKVVPRLAPHPNQPLTFVTAPIAASDELAALSALTPSIRRHLIYTWNQSVIMTPVSSARVDMPEEMPILFAFYHLSNVVRYNPEFLARLEDSKCWPVLLALRKHACLRFLMLFWSFMQRMCVVLRSPPL